MNTPSVQYLQKCASVGDGVAQNFLKHLPAPDTSIGGGIVNNYIDGLAGAGAGTGIAAGYFGADHALKNPGTRLSQFLESTNKGIAGKGGPRGLAFARAGGAGILARLLAAGALGTGGFIGGGKIRDYIQENRPKSAALSASDKLILAGML